MEEIKTKICKDCLENKNIDNFYILSTSYTSPYCKKCHNHRRTLDYRKLPKKIKITKWDKLGYDLQNEIKNLIKENYKLTKISNKLNIKYTTLQNFRQKKLI